jgi:uncharacterized membrane protein (UPF0127 family)
MPKPAAARTASVRNQNKTPLRAIFSKNKYYLQFVILALVITGVVVTALAVGEKATPKLASKQAVSACGPYRNDRTVTVNGATIQVEVPRTAAAFAKGLGGRPCILPNQGMLFAFTKPGQYAFWMKDMKFPIDIIWIGADHKAAAEEIDLSPKTYPDRFINKDRPAQFVLELKANRSKELNISLGTPINF